jgi:hypothetical protein
MDVWKKAYSESITYNKGRRGREAFSIHPSVPSSIHGWHHTGKKTLAEINNLLSTHVSLFRKSMPGPGLWSLPWSAVCCYLTGHKQCKHQDFQQPGSHEYMRNVVCREVLEM